MMEVYDVTKRYGKNVAVDHLSFEVRPGEVTGFLGPDGPGRRPRFGWWSGSTPPTSGRFAVDGHAYRDLRFPLPHVGALLEAGPSTGPQRPGPSPPERHDFLDEGCPSRPIIARWPAVIEA